MGLQLQSLLGPVCPVCNIAHGPLNHLQLLLCSTHAQSVLKNGFIHDELTAAWTLTSPVLPCEQAVHVSGLDQEPESCSVI